MKNITEPMKNKEPNYKISVRERCQFLEKSVNDVLDRVYFGTESIKHQILSPIHGLNYTDMQVLVKIVSLHFSTKVPESFTRYIYRDAIVDAKRLGVEMPSDLLTKYACLNENEEAEIAYRVYAYLKMKEILTEHFMEL